MDYKGGVDTSDMDLDEVKAAVGERGARRARSSVATTQPPFAPEPCLAPHPHLLYTLDPPSHVREYSVGVESTIPCRTIPHGRIR